MTNKEAITFLRHAMGHLQRVQNEYPPKEEHTALGRGAIPEAISIIDRHCISPLIQQDLPPRPLIVQNSPERDWFLHGPDFAVDSDE